MKKGITAVVLVLLLSGLVCAKTLVIGFDDDLVTLDPADFSHRQTEAMLRQVYEGLSTYTPDREIVPELALSITAIEPTLYEIKVRPGVKFHDGSPLTAEDVAFSINRLVKEGAMAGRTSQRRGLMGPTKGAVAVDEYTVHVELANPWPLFPRFIPWQMIVPKSVGDSYIDKPVGTGPFVFEEWVRDSHFSVVRNPEYWGDPPKVDRVVFRVIGDESARVSALRSGEVDIATFIPVHEISSLENHPEIDVVSVLGTRSYFLEMNVNKPPFNDIRVRQAMNHAVDMDTIINVIYEGRATRIPFILSPQAFAYHDGLPMFDYDPEKARRLLAEAGYPNGFSFELDTVDAHRARAEIYQAMLAEVGIDVKIRTWPTWGAVREAWMQMKDKPVAEQRDAFLNDWGNASLDPFDILIPKFHSDHRGLGRGNFSGFADPEVDRLLEASLESDNNEERLMLFRQAQEIIHAQVPMVFEFVAHEIYGVRSRVKNWRPSPDSRIHLKEVELAH
ncbi:MAG: ABC transporter substrate-binding protein [Firmicutes bacterium]|jgi:peptide/nickel transport system substrate-binding protein|nr:ABC transporter substrate-binding protein [Bacillota bacterium]